MNFNTDAHIGSRFYSHFRFGTKRDIEIKSTDKTQAYQHKPNLIEKTGNGILRTLNSLPRVVRWVGRQFQDPRVVTVALTVTALFLTTLAFYPAITISALTACFTAVKLMLASIPLWSVKLTAYILASSAIVGFGARAAGRFANADLMKNFYGLPQSYRGNPANMSIQEIRDVITNEKYKNLPTSDRETVVSSVKEKREVIKKIEDTRNSYNKLPKTLTENNSDLSTKKRLEFVNYYRDINEAYYRLNWQLKPHQPNITFQQKLDVLMKNNIAVPKPPETPPASVHSGENSEES